MSQFVMFVIGFVLGGVIGMFVLSIFMGGNTDE